MKSKLLEQAKALKCNCFVDPYVVTEEAPCFIVWFSLKLGFALLHLIADELITWIWETNVGSVAVDNLVMSCAGCSSNAEVQRTSDNIPQPL